MNDGTTHLREPSTNEDIAVAYVDTVSGVAREQWVVLDKFKYVDAVLECRQTSTTTQSLTAAALATFQAQEEATGADYLYATYRAEYFEMPTDAAIAALPDKNPPAVLGTFVYDVTSNPNGTAGAIAAQLFRERLDAPGDKAEYRDHWVFFDDYYAPAANDTMTIRPNRTSNRPRTLREFLTAMRQKQRALPAERQAGWRYSPVTYTFGQLPTKVL